MIHSARGDGASRHAVIVGLGDLLGDDKAALRLDRFQPSAAIGACARQDDATMRAPKTLANDFNRKSNGNRAPCRSVGLESRNTPLPSTER